MGKPTTGEELLAVLESSQLVHKNLLDTLRTQLKSLGPTAQDPQKLALILIKNKVCTTYQVRQLLEGRFKGFYIGKYKFLELLGAGGMGKVYLAEQITMQRLVAIKVVRQNIPKHMQKEVLARFTREARAVAGLQHHNIIRAYDFDQENGIPYFVMEYVEGIDAANQVIKFGPIPYQQAADYMMQAASALQHAHKNGMVHRDIKPGNLLVATSGEIKVLDLGLVACFDGTQNHSLTVAENQLGTIDYIAPEQALDSHKVDPRADIYSLGATFYTIISGKVLFPGKTTAQKLLLNQMEPPVHIKQHVPDIPDELAAAIHKMLAKKPEDRFQNCEEVIQALTPYSSRIVPPYDPTAVKFRISEIDEYLGRSPEASQINFNLINQDTPTADAKINSSSDTKKPVSPSGVTKDSGTQSSQAEDEFLKAINEMAELDLPSVPRKKAAAAAARGGTATMAPPSAINARSTIGSRSRVTNKKPIKKKSNDSQTVTLVAAISTLMIAVLFIVFYSVSSLFDRDSREVSPSPMTQQQLDKKIDESKKNQPAETKPASNNVAKNEEKKPNNNKKNEEKKPKPEGEKPKPPADTSVANKKPDEKPPGVDVAMTPANTSKTNEKKPDEKKPDSKDDKPATPASPEERWLAYTKQMQDDETLVWHSTFLKGKDNKGTAADNQAGKSPIAKAKLASRNIQPAPGRFENKEAVGFQNKLADEFIGVSHEFLQQVDFSKGVTLAVWFRADPENNESYALMNRGRTSWRIHRIKGKGALQFSTGPINTRNQVEVETTSDFTPGDWHQVVGTIRPVAGEEQAVLTVYLDGQKESAKKGPLLTAEVPTGLMLGQAQETTGSRLGFRGLIDEFAIYNRPLSDDEVRQMYEAGNQQPTPAGVAASSN
ncbi:protein kinase domain-containing protein [Lacunimicrobium album]